MWLMGWLCGTCCTGRGLRVWGDPELRPRVVAHPMGCSRVRLLLSVMKLSCLITSCPPDPSADRAQLHVNVHERSRCFPHFGRPALRMHGPELASSRTLQTQSLGGYADGYAIR